MISLENIHTSNIIQNGLVIFRNAYYYTNTHVYAITICEKGGHECEKRSSKGASREEKEWRNVVIIF